MSPSTPPPTTKKLLTIFGASGNQGGSILATYLSFPHLSATYTLRGITRSPTSPGALALTAQGISMVRADLDDPASLRAAVRGSHGVFGVTDFGASRSKAVEVGQGKAIFEACRAEGVGHLVWSSLPRVEAFTAGKLRRVEHFDSKAEVERFTEARKGVGGDGGEFLHAGAAMFTTFAARQAVLRDGVPTIGLPFPHADVPWPLLSPQHDAGPYVLGLFAAGAAADGGRAHAVSAWTTPQELVAVLSKAAGREVRFRCISAEEYQRTFEEEVVGAELMETMRWGSEWGYFGPGAQGRQAESDGWLLKGTEKMGLVRWVAENGQWRWE